ATPFGIYLQAYEHRHQPLVLDDVDGTPVEEKKSAFIKNLVHGRSISPDGKRCAFEDPGLPALPRRRGRLQRQAGPDGPAVPPNPLVVAGRLRRVRAAPSIPTPKAGDDSMAGRTETSIRACPWTFSTVPLMPTTASNLIEVTVVAGSVKVHLESPCPSPRLFS